MGKLLLLINTVKYLKWQQIYFRIVRRVVKPKVTDRFNNGCPQRSNEWKHLALYEEKIDQYLDDAVLQLNNFRELRGYGWKGFKTF